MFRDEMIKTLVVSLLLLSGVVNAKQESTSLFVKYEFNADDRIVGVGTSFLTQDYHSNVRGEAISSINHSEILDENDHYQNYISWDVGVRLGYYNNVFVYVEGGMDFLELIIDGDKDDDNSFEDRDTGNGIDGYAAIGAGIIVDKLRLEGFVKARKIDGDYWESKHQIFYGAQISLLF
jgi:hypothetical protein